MKRLIAAGALLVVGACTSATPEPEEWKICRDEQHGFSLRYPPDWRSTTSEDRCVQLQKRGSQLPEGVPQVDIFIRVMPVQGEFPTNYLRDDLLPGQGRVGVSTGVKYKDREELEVSGLPAVRARFEATGGPTPNWGIEYAVRKDDQVLDIYISQPTPEIEVLFEGVVRTLQW